MTAQQLIELGFKKKKFDDSYWYELRIGKKHKFITNDTYGMVKKGEQFVAYELEDGNTFWFNRNVNSLERFLSIKKILTGK